VTPPLTQPALQQHADGVWLADPDPGGQAAPTEHSWSLIVCGDWLPGAEQQELLATNPTACYGDVLPLLQATELAIVNLECVLADEPLSPAVKDGETLRVPTQVVAGLAGVPFHLVCLANNHIFDFGLPGLQTTRATLAQAQLQAIGAGSSPAEAATPAIFRRGATRIGVINVAEGEEAAATPDRPAGAASLESAQFQSQLQALRAQVDVLVVVVHAGREFVPVPMPHIRRAYRALIAAGVDLVVGHHPHVPQGVEIYQGKPIVYSLGNFTFFLDSPADYQHRGYLVQVHFCGSTLRKLELHPYDITPTSLRLLTGQQRDDFLRDLTDLSSVITDDERLTAIWDAYTDRWLTTHGLPELAQGIATLGRPRLLMQAMLMATLPHYAGNALHHRLIRRALLAAIRRLGTQHTPATLAADRRLAAQYGANAAVLRNRFHTASHRDVYLHALQRVMDGCHGQAPLWAHALLERWQVWG
jgi:poly-gamma-glutamate capsule biosynthesis protein CapA/YwtB (metallophosphatase superfamily)